MKLKTKKKCLNNRAYYENLDLSRFWRGGSKIMKPKVTDTTM